ncbi:DinB family protein [Terriglobus roseus]|uniref:DinB superfamily protein n=1 Tax=Terriglobus roseus TaxID=392734 RepID=A0A1H4LUG6_9BACT|nr:DinB family protein [Terriglobus roseus]SEB74296.1 DinB superfamily protein [Terriglobus roseus]
MKIGVGVMVLLAASAASMTVQAQDAVNPVVSSANEIVVRQSAYIITAAEQMPADKYGYRPTPDQWTYGKIVAHVTQANFGVCGMLTGDSAGKGPAVAETDPKEKLVAVLKQSFDTCKTAMDGLKDASLGGTITYFGGAKKPRARALVELTDDLEDHYSQMASYLRLNSMVPPSAKK